MQCVPSLLQSHSLSLRIRLLATFLVEVASFQSKGFCLGSQEVKLVLVETHHENEVAYPDFLVLHIARIATEEKKSGMLDPMTVKALHGGVLVG